MNEQKNRADAMNRVGEFINEKAPIVFAYLKNGFKQKEDGTLYKKDEEALREILADKNGVCCLIYYGKYSLTFEAKTSYKTSEESYDYYERSFSFYPETMRECFEKQRTDFTQKEIEDALKEQNEIELKISRMKDRWFSLSMLTGQNY